MSELKILEQFKFRAEREPIFPELFEYEDQPIYTKDGFYHQKYRKMRVYCNVDIGDLNLRQMYQVIPFETLFGADIAERCVTYTIIIIAPEPESTDTLAEQALFCFIVGSIVKLNAYTEFHKVKFEMSGASLASALKKERTQSEGNNE